MSGRSSAEVSEAGKLPARPRRDEVVRAAAKMFRANGYRATSITSIGDELGFTSAALYYYMGSKEDLLVEVMTQPHRDLVDIARKVAAVDLPAVDRLRQLVFDHVEYMLAERDRFSVMLSERRELPPEPAREIEELEQEYFNHVRRLIDEAVAEKAFEVEDSPVAALALLGAINWTNRWYRDGGQYSAAEVAGLQFELFTRGAFRRTDR